MPRSRVPALLIGAVLSVVLAACSGGSARTSPRPASRAPSSLAPGDHATDPRDGTAARAAKLGRWRHVVVVVEENRDESHILAGRSAPYLNRLARGGLVLTDMHGETHPSQPNYLALFSGSTQRVRDDSCPHRFRGPSLASQLPATGITFGAFSEGLPRTGSKTCRAGAYVRRHAPWTNFAGVPRSVQHPMTAFPRDPSRLPAVSFVIPNLEHDMHDGSIAAGDRWLQSRLGRYATWARTHRSLLLVTWDEDENTRSNHIATLAYGQGIAPGRWTRRADHYSLLATLERTFGLPRLGQAAHRAAITPLL